MDQPSALTSGVGPGQTALLLASHQGHLKLVRFLLKAGADPNAAAKDGATPLIAAASGGAHTGSGRATRAMSSEML